MRWLLGLLILAALGGAGWLLHSTTAQGQAPEAEPENPAPVEAVTEAGGVLLQGHGGEGLRVSRGAMGRAALECRVVREGQPALAVVEVRFVAAAQEVQQALWWQRWQKDMFTPPSAPGALPPATATGTSDALGKLLFEHLAPGGYRLSARTTDGWRAEANALLATDGARAVVTLEVKAGNQTLEGRITWSDGRPVAGTLVLSPPLMNANRSVSLSTTIGQVGVELGPDGSFQVGGLVAGSHGVRILTATGGGAGLAVTGPPAVLPATKPYLLVLEMPGLRVTGRVFDGGTDSPVPGAIVMCHSSVGATNTWGILRTTAGEDGRFELMLARVPASVYATATGFGMTQRQVLVAGSEMTLRLLRVARIAGRVTTPDGQPAAGAVVGASCGGQSLGQTRFSATADREGRYALEDVFAGEAFVAVRGGGWVSADVGDVRENGFNPLAVNVPGGASLTLDLLAVPAGRIEGKALDAAGAPVAGASVTAQVGGLANGAQMPWRLTQALGFETAATNADGAFVLADLVPGLTYNLSANAPDQPQASAGPFTVSAEAPTTAEVRFPAARFADVRVLFEGEETPVAEARVTLVFLQEQGGWNHAAQAPTDREGRARVGPVGPGALGVLVGGEAVAARPGPPIPLEGSKDGPGPFTLTVRVQHGKTIEGRVLKPDGTPAAGASVNAQAKDGSSGQGATTAADGSFTVKGLGGGSFNLNASLNQQPKPQLNGFMAAEAGATGVLLMLVESTLPSREAIVVRVLDDRGEPVRSASVNLQAQGGSSWGNSLNEGSARFEFDKQNNGWVYNALTNGTLYVVVSGARGWADLPLSAGPTRVGPLAAEQREVEVRLAAERAIEGRVVNADGTPVRGVLVRANFSGSGDGAVPSQGEGRSDEQGRFRVGGLGEGEHVLSAAVPPDYLAPEAVKAPAGAKNVEIRLKRGVTARVRVRDADGQPLAKANVNLGPRAPDTVPQPGQPRRRQWSSNQQQVGTVTGPDGTALMRGLDPDAQWVLSVNPNREDLRPYAQDRWTAADCEVRLERGYVVTGVVRDPQGRPMPGSQVLRREGENNWNGIGVNQDGTFKITGLERGHVTLAAWAPGVNVDVNDPNLQVLTVAAGTQDLVLTVDPGFELVVRITNVADRGPNGRNAQFTLSTRRGEQWVQVGSQQDNDGTGRTVFRGLKADERYTVWVQPVTGNEYYGLLTDLKPGGGEITLRLERGGTIQGRVTVAGTYENLWVGAGNDLGCWVYGTVDADGRYEIRGVPYGLRWKVNAWANVAKQHWSTQAEAAVGGVVDLRLEAPTNR